MLRKLEKQTFCQNCTFSRFVRKDTILHPMESFLTAATEVSACSFHFSKLRKSVVSKVTRCPLSWLAWPTYLTCLRTLSCYSLSESSRHCMLLWKSQFDASSSNALNLFNIFFFTKLTNSNNFSMLPMQQQHYEWSMVYSCSNGKSYVTNMQWKYWLDRFCSYEVMLYLLFSSIISAEKLSEIRTVATNWTYTAEVTLWVTSMCIQGSSPTFVFSTILIVTRLVLKAADTVVPNFWVWR